MALWEDLKRQYGHHKGMIIGISVSKDGMGGNAERVMPWVVEAQRTRHVSTIDE